MGGTRWRKWHFFLFWSELWYKWKTSWVWERHWYTRWGVCFGIWIIVPEWLLLLVFWMGVKSVGFLPFFQLTYAVWRSVLLKDFFENERWFPWIYDRCYSLAVVFCCVFPEDYNKLCSVPMVVPERPGYPPPPIGPIPPVHPVPPGFPPGPAIPAPQPPVDYPYPSRRPSKNSEVI